MSLTIEIYIGVKKSGWLRRCMQLINLLYYIIGSPACWQYKVVIALKVKVYRKQDFKVFTIAMDISSLSRYSTFLDIQMKQPPTSYCVIGVYETAYFVTYKNKKYLRLHLHVCML